MFEQFQGVPPAHAAVVHAILMHRLQAGVAKHSCHLCDAAENLRRDDAFVVTRLVTHDADKSCAEPLHAGNAPIDFRQGDVKRIRNLFGPIGNGRPKTIDADARLTETVRGNVECLVGNIVKVGFGKSRHFHGAKLQAVPSEFLRRLDLGIEADACFIADAG